MSQRAKREGGSHRKVYSEKCFRIFQHIFEAYQGAGKSIYETAA